MLTALPHFLWLAFSAAIAGWLLLPKSSARFELRWAAFVVLLVLVADLAFGLEVLRVLAAVAGGGLALAAILLGDGEDPGLGVREASTRKSKAEAAKPTRPEISYPLGSLSPVLAEAIHRWSEPAALSDEDGVLLWANARWAESHGIADPVGKKWSEFSPAKDEVRWQILLERAHENGIASGGLDHRGPGEAATNWSSKAQAIVLDGGDGKRIFIAATRLDSGEANLRQQSREIGHSLNNVLSAVVGNVGLAIETPGIDPTLKADLKEAEEGALRAAELIHGLQSLARGDADDP